MRGKVYCYANVSIVFGPMFVFLAEANVSERGSKLLLGGGVPCPSPESQTSGTLKN